MRNCLGSRTRLHRCNLTRSPTNSQHSLQGYRAHIKADKSQGYFSMFSLSDPSAARFSAPTMGTYHDFISAQSKRNPSIHNLLAFMDDDGRETSSCRLASLDFSSDHSGPTTQDIDEKSLQDLLRVSTSSGRSKLLGRIIIVEDLTKNIVEILGSSLHMDPLFFASHLHSPWPDISFQTPDMALLPSRLKPETYLTMHYHRTIKFKDPEIPLRKLLRTCNIHRKVMVLPKTKNIRIGLAQHSCSIFKTVLPDNTWICIVLVDPPIGNSYYSVKQQEAEITHDNILSDLFLGGYDDFMDPPSMTDKSCFSSGPSRTGMFDDLPYFWKRHLPEIFDRSSPTLIQLAYYPLRIVASEWVIYLAVMHHSIKQYEYAVEDLPVLFQELDRLNSDLRSLQSWRRRSMSSQQKMRSISHFIRCCNNTKHHSGPLELLAKDYDHLAANVDDFGQRFERMLPVVTSMVQIVDSRRSFAETANVSRLTYLALVFVPLTFTTGLFSMNSETAPGSQGFWIFFAVAIPVTAAVFLAARPPVKETRQILDYLSRLQARALSRYRGPSLNESHTLELGESIQSPSPSPVVNTLAFPSEGNIRIGGER